MRFIIIILFSFVFFNFTNAQQIITIKKQPSISGYYSGEGNGMQIHLLFTEDNEVAFLIVSLEKKVKNPKGLLAACLLDSICENASKTTYTLDSTSLEFKLLTKKNNQMYLKMFEGAFSNQYKNVEIRKTETDRLREVYILKRKK